jgi:uncharacterized membrane protein YgcG
VRAADAADDLRALEAVALHGDRALLVVEPHLARDAVLTGPLPRREDLLPDAPDTPGPLTTRMYRELHDRDGDGDGYGHDGGGGHGAGGHHSCGGGSGCGGGY